MSWSKAFTAVLFSALLAGCGFHPLYARGPAGGGAQDFATVRVAPVADRIGQQFRNDLIDMLTPKGEPENPRYILRAELTESIQDLAVAKSANATRGNVHMSVTFRLEQVGGDVVLSGTSASIASYNVLESEFATRSALENVRERTVRQLAENVRVRLGVFFRRADQAPTDAH